jgi:hypothetical protein
MVQTCSVRFKTNHVNFFIFYRADFPNIEGPSPRDYQLIDVSFRFCLVFCHTKEKEPYSSVLMLLFEQCRYCFVEKSTTKL